MKQIVFEPKTKPKLAQHSNESNEVNLSKEILRRVNSAQKLDRSNQLSEIFEESEEKYSDEKEQAKFKFSNFSSALSNPESSPSTKKFKNEQSSLEIQSFNVLSQYHLPKKTSKSIKWIKLSK